VEEITSPTANMERGNKGEWILSVRTLARGHTLEELHKYVGCVSGHYLNGSLCLCEVVTLPNCRPTSVVCSVSVRFVVKVAFSCHNNERKDLVLFPEPTSDNLPRFWGTRTSGHSLRLEEVSDRDIHRLTSSAGITGGLRRISPEADDNIKADVRVPL
jgi:hypothetical protein